MKWLSYEERKIIETKYNEGKDVPVIARGLNRSSKTIYKELLRGDTGKMDKNGRREYSAQLAQEKQYKARGRIRRPVLTN